MSSGTPHPFGARSKYGKYTPDDVRKGVRRSEESGGHRLYNGHRHVPAYTRSQILAFMERLGRPTTVQEIGSELHADPDTIGRILNSMRADGDSVQRSETRAGQRGRYVWWLEDATERVLPGDQKTCTKCKQSRPLTDFGRDRNAKSGRRPDCKQCRAPRPERWKPYPDRV